MLLIIILILVAFIYFYVSKSMNYWKDRNVVYEKGYPIVGNNLETVLRKRSNTDVFENIYKKHSNRRYVGIFSFSTPALLINDPNLMKRIMVKEFDTFPEHRRFFPTDVDPLWNKNLFAMKGGEEWHELRSTLSPSFTSSKMKALFVLMKECSKQFSNYFLKQEDHCIEVELKDAFARFGTDVIATTAFGVTCNSLEEPKNEFYMMAKRVNSFRGFKGLVFLLNFLAPNIAKYIKIPVFDKEVATFFRSIVKDAIRVRKEKGVVRPDMLHLLMEAQKGNLTYEENNGLPDAGFAAVEESQHGKMQRKHKVEVTDEIITAQVLIFFFAGFDTVSNLLSFITYELAINVDIQERLYREVNEVLQNSNGEFTYDNLMNMKYLDMVISETLRKWPPFIFIDRASVKPFTIEPEKPGESPLTLEKGSIIICPIKCIQMDPKNYPNPDKFDPERFSGENKHNIDPYTYLPFGVGPRNCIGSRFALLECKLIVAELISKFKVVPVSKTKIPIVLSKSNFNPIPDEGIFVGFESRK